MAEEESLVARRPKRSTAGNRMELALAELALEEPQEVEEDIDFVVEKEEEDVFESDFASTDEEAAQEDVDEGDRAVREEERRERNTARTRVEKATAAAHARQRVTFNPETTSSPRSQVTQKPKRRVSLGVVVNAETGEVIVSGAGTVGVKRQSQRRHTVMNTSATVNRIKDAEEKRAAIPKKTKTTIRLPTQDELIARALDTEEGNITEHRNYLRLEEEKRAKARVVKQAIEGPVLRWISKKETIQVEVQPPLPPPPPPTTTTAMSSSLYAAKYSFVYTSAGVGGTVGSQAYSMPFYAYMPLVAQTPASKPQGADASASVTATTSSNGNLAVSSAGAPTALTSLVTQSTPSLPAASSSNEPATPTTGPISSVPSDSSWRQQPQPSSQAQPQVMTQSQNSAQTQTQPVFFSYPPASTAPLITHRTEDVCKNYVIHELSQSTPSKPPWNDTMTAMFGDHVRWDEVKVFTSKGRPLARPVRTCPITGQPAKYCDPRTNVPFANVSGYEVLTKVIGRGYVWCSALGCYVGVNETSPRDRRLSGAGGAASATVGKSVGTSTGVTEIATGEQEDGKLVVEEPEERIAKRRRVEVTDG